MRKLALWIPLALFAVFVAIAAFQLPRPRDDTVRSRMIGHPLPPFDLPGATDDAPRLANAYFTDGKPRLLNIWASWCVPCVAEAPQLAQLKRRGVPIVGIAVRDTPDAIAQFLSRYGDPYMRVARDDISEVALGIGSSGYPETYVIDGKGVIRYQHIGEIREADVPMLIDRLEAAR